MSISTNGSCESIRISNCLPSFIYQPIHILNKVFRRVSVTKKSTDESRSNNGGPSDDFNDNGENVNFSCRRGCPLKNTSKTYVQSSAKMDSVNGHVEVQNGSRNLARRGRPLGNTTKEDVPSRNVARKGRCWRSQRYIYMPYRTMFVGGEMFHRVPSSHERKVAMGLTSKGEERLFYSNRWHSYGYWSSSSEESDQDNTEV